MPEPREGFVDDELAPWEQEAPLSSWEAVDLAPVLRGERVTPPPSVLEREDHVRLLYPARLNLFIGETESLKTWAALVAARQELSAGHHVVVVDYEDTPESGVERLRALGASAEEIAEHLTYIRPDGRFDELAQAIVADRIALLGPVSLAIVDSITEAMSQVGLDPSKGPDVAAFYSGFPRWFARTGAAVLLIDHVTKSAEGRGRWAIGSERKLSGLDGAAYAFDTLVPFGRERTGKVKITVSKDRCGHVRQHEGAGRVIAQLELKSWPDGGVTTTLSAPEMASEGSFRPTVLMEKLSQAIEQNPGLTSRALRSAVRGKNDAKDLALELLVNEDYVAVEPGPRGARLHHPLRPFGEPDEGAQNDVDF
jgi:hypothetical protein